MEALVTLLFFVALWGLALALKRLAPRSPDLRKLSQALTGGPPVDPTGGEPLQKPPPVDPAQPPAAAAPATPEAQPSTTTKP